MKEFDFDQWVSYGVDKGWITPGFCYTHDGDPYMTEEEEQAYETGEDLCFPIFKYIG